LRINKTAVFQIRVDLRSLATLHKHYSSRGLEIRTISTLARRALEFLSDTMVEQLGAKPFETTEQAKEYFNSLGLMGPLRRRGSNTIRTGMQEESLRLDGFNPEYMQEKGLETIDPNQVQKAKELLQKRLDNGIQSSILGKTTGEVKGG
jgi:hypothetical protein